MFRNAKSGSTVLAFFIFIARDDASQKLAHVLADRGVALVDHQHEVQREEGAGEVVEGSRDPVRVLDAAARQEEQKKHDERFSVQQYETQPRMAPRAVEVPALATVLQSVVARMSVRSEQREALQLPCGARC